MRFKLFLLGLRPFRIVVPDVRSPFFRKQAHRQSLAVAASSQARKEQAFIDDVSDLDGQDAARSGPSLAARIMQASRARVPAHHRAEWVQRLLATSD
ncbi:antitoxin MazE-like protein [Bradyrhizobium archetypum]|uniref:Antitoxin MazE family protein n=1 Tax=Bradyrhizobium archetypum TaxID=2721160 RepID=A0A7Y4HB99_9BRAD|nr:antitoxin MazE-like protein [Bradyrhizobium archetypum]NOJ50127.1 antitoxin MazE family protein [Bradyrhizobium archetypum]